MKLIRLALLAVFIPVEAPAALPRVTLPESGGRGGAVMAPAAVGSSLALPAALTVVPPVVPALLAVPAPNAAAPVVAVSASAE